jgi:glucose-1-phosphate adenylyltransferase
VHVNPELNIYDEEWPIWTYQVQQPPAKFVLDDVDRRGHAINSMLAGGCIVSGAEIRSSLLFSNVRVDERSMIDRSVILPHVKIGAGSVVRRAIIDEGCELPPGSRIGVDPVADRQRFHVTEKGVVLVTPDLLRAT